MGSLIIGESRLRLVTSAPSSSASIIGIRQQHSEFDRVLKSRWKEAADSAVCFYRLDRLQTKVIAGKYGFVAQVCKYTAQTLHLNSSITINFLSNLVNFISDFEYIIISTIRKSPNPDGGDRLRISRRWIPISMSNSLTLIKLPRGKSSWGRMSYQQSNKTKAIRSSSSTSVRSNSAVVYWCPGWRKISRSSSRFTACKFCCQPFCSAPIRKYTRQYYSQHYLFFSN